MGKQHAMLFLWKSSLCWFVDSPHSCEGFLVSFAVNIPSFKSTINWKIINVYSLLAEEWFLPMSAKLRIIGKRLMFDSRGFFCSFSC